MHRLARVGKSRLNACRDLHRILHKTKGVLLPIKIDVCAVHIMRKRPVRRYQVWFPILKLSSWINYFVKNKPQMILGGYHVSQAQEWQMMLGAFWQTYQATNPGHPVFSTPFDLKGCVPNFLHGDEGRGLARRPFMVLSWQTVISHHGPGVCNDSTQLGGH